MTIKIRAGCLTFASLEGTWQPDLVFVLQQEVAMYDAYEERIAECDQALEQHLKGVADKVLGTAEPLHGQPAPTGRQSLQARPG